MCNREVQWWIGGTRQRVCREWRGQRSWRAGRGMVPRRPLCPVHKRGPVQEPRPQLIVVGLTAFRWSTTEGCGCDRGGGSERGPSHEYDLRAPPVLCTLGSPLGSAMSPHRTCSTCLSRLSTALSKPGIMVKAFFSPDLGRALRMARGCAGSLREVEKRSGPTANQVSPEA